MAEVLPFCWAKLLTPTCPVLCPPAEVVLPFRAGYTLQGTASTVPVGAGGGASPRITHPDFLDARRKIPCTHCQPDGFILTDGTQ